MSEQQDVIASFGDAGLLAGIRWAYLSATGRVLEDYSEATGHDVTWAGITRFTLFRDRLDRVFACGGYAVPAGSNAAVSLDQLHAGLSEWDINTMPQLATDLVMRADLNGSPGWAWQDWRFLLASCAFGKIDQVPWPQKSPTKQRVARQHNPDAAQGSLFEGLADEEVGGLEALLAAANRLDRNTLVVAHALDVDHGGRELVLGRARLNTGGGPAWHWYQDLLDGPSPGGGYGTTEPSLPTGPDTAPDAPVRLRRQTGEQHDNRGRDQR
jgi:hypothetical protein